MFCSASRTEALASVERGLRGRGRRHRRLVLLPGNLVLVDQQLVARHVVAGLLEVRLGFADLGLRRFEPRPCGGQLALRAQHERGRVRPGRRRRLQLTRGVGGDDRNIDARAFERRFGVSQVRLRLRERDLVVARIEPHQDVSGIYVLLVFGPHLNHVPGNPSAHGIDVAVDLGVVGGFVRVQVPPQVIARDAQNHDDHRGDEIARDPGPSARERSGSFSSAAMATSPPEAVGFPARCRPGPAPARPSPRCGQRAPRSACRWRSRPTPAPARPRSCRTRPAENRSRAWTSV